MLRASVARPSLLRAALLAASLPIVPAGDRGGGITHRDFFLFKRVGQRRVGSCSPTTLLSCLLLYNSTFPTGMLHVLWLRMA